MQRKFLGFLLGSVYFTLATAPALSQESVSSQSVNPSPLLEVTVETAEKISDRSHPDYVRCRSEPIIGSRAKKRRVCMTNQQWSEFGRLGYKYTKEFLDDIRSGMNNNGL